MIYFNLDNKRMIAISICHFTYLFENLSVFLQACFKVAKYKGYSVHLRDTLLANDFHFPVSFSN